MVLDLTYATNMIFTKLSLKFKKLQNLHLVQQSTDCGTMCQCIILFEVLSSFPIYYSAI